MLKVIRRSIVKLSRDSHIQDGRCISFLLSWCTATETPIGIKLRLLQLLSSVKDRVSNTAFYIILPLLVVKLQLM